MKPYRTMISVPGHKPSWYDKAVNAGADAICFDLEDSVPDQMRDEAREAVAEGITRISKEYPAVGLFVRPSGITTGLFGADVEAVIVPGITGIFPPKTRYRDDIIAYDALVDHFEQKSGASGIEYMIPIETIEGIVNCTEIATASPRIGGMIGPTAEHADIAIAIGYEQTEMGLESLYHRSRILVAARNANLHPFTALWERIHDLEGLEKWTIESRTRGFRGQIVLHPTHIPVVNRVYTPDQKQIDFYQGLLDTYNEAAARGEGAVMYGDIHIDKAHADKAEAWLERVSQLAALHGGI
jgi:citrate lyase subunit beta/citryl-CoA lyase